MPPDQLKNLWAIFKVFCSEAARSTHLNSDSATSFLGWLEHREEIGNSRYTNGVTDGYLNATYEFKAQNPKLASKQDA